jgi:membrane-bound acyltransferase YfiQ involved in biofilm formation
LGDRKYSSNLLAAIVAVILTVAVSAGYMIYFDMALTPQIAVIVVAMTFLSFLASTVGFDKIKQLIEQLGA